MRSVMPAARTVGSVTTSARATPSRSSSQPASAEAPGPNFSGVASTVKTVSRVVTRRAYPVWAALSRVTIRSSSAAPSSVAPIAGSSSGNDHRPDAPSRRASCGSPGA